MKKIFVITICLLVCGGCNIKYNLDVSNFEENIDVSNVIMNNENEFVSPMEMIFQGRPYNTEFISEKEVVAQQKWNNITDYMNYSILINEYINKDNIVVNGSKVLFDITLSNDALDTINALGNVDKVQISLYIPYYVKKHNADKVDKKANTYTWVIDDISNRQILINFDMSKPADYIKKIISYCVIGVIVIAIICVIIYFVQRNKKANEI